jgi:hypothetical protein
MDEARPCIGAHCRSPSILHRHLPSANAAVSSGEQVSMFGLQLVWSTEMAYASPYLLSLGESLRVFTDHAGESQILAESLLRHNCSCLIDPHLCYFRLIEIWDERCLSSWTSVRSVRDQIPIHVLHATAQTALLCCDTGLIVQPIIGISRQSYSSYSRACCN